MENDILYVNIEGNDKGNYLLFNCNGMYALIGRNINPWFIIPEFSRLIDTKKELTPFKDFHMDHIIGRGGFEIDMIERKICFYKNSYDGPLKDDLGPIKELAPQIRKATGLEVKVRD